ncbi:hypothetical protein D6C84_06657 [Aureobasidium pullulans]|uniref:Zn(2)-C6 fungal-type domain-containing protein n=1 Tax=Aureobasidium pullulans TaxID=5580 RepID=A0A4S9XR57_AURPU|nr:hypothetical protein D6C84_06657 [Aureobasidium pullulans]
MSFTSPDPVSPNIDDGTNPRKRQRTACDRCKGRKQKCDNAYPQCSNCAKAGKECNKPLDTEIMSNSYTRALEDQVAHLEKRLMAMERQQPRQSQTQANPRSAVNSLSFSTGVEHTSTQNLGNNGVDTTEGLGSPFRQEVNVADVVGILSLGNGNSETYIGSSSGYALATDLGRMRQTAHESVGARSNSDTNDGQHSFASPAYNQTGFALFVLNMVYSIGALNLRLTDQSYRDTPPEQFYLSAMQHVASVREASPIDNLQALVLLILYHLRSESRNGLWHLTGLAMRTVTDIGLHREASTRNLPPLEAQLRRRLFWSVYALESILAGALGRPISLSDCDIDQPLPLSVNDSDRMREPNTSFMSHGSTPGQEANPTTNLSQFILLSQLRTFEARIQRTIYRVDRTTSALQPKMHRLISELDTWRQNIPSSLQSSEHERLMLHYHRDVRLLLQPFLAMLEPNSDLFRRCVDAAGQICQIHKRFHQTPEYGHSFVAVHTVFVSGITLLYALWRGKSNIWSFGISNDIRAASCVLAIMGERAPWIRRFRDEFDALTEATMAALQNASSEPGVETRLGDEMPAYDFSVFDGLEITDAAALDMVRELSQWFQS